MCALNFPILKRTHPVFPGVLAIFVIGAFFLALPFHHAWAAPQASIKIASGQKDTPDQQYQAAKKNLSRLEQEKAFGKDRSNWLNNASSFRQLHRSQKKGELGPPSLYMTAKVYRLTYSRFHIADDLDKAMLAYRELADLYPGHYLADDALLERAELLAANRAHEQEIRALYQQIVDLYPQGDQYQKARTFLSPPQNTEAKKTAATAPSPIASNGNLAHIAPAKFWSSAEYGRVVIESSAPLSFKETFNQSNDQHHRQLVLELEQSFIAPSLRAPTRMEAGLLKQVQTMQTNDKTVQVRFDFEPFAEYKIFTLNDPFRIIVDVHGQGETVSLVSKDKDQSQAAPVPDQPLQGTTGTVNANPIPISLTDLKKFPAEQRLPPQGITRTKSKESLSLAQQLGLGVRKIVIDPGHGGKDPGAMAFGLKEKDIVLAIAKKLANVLTSRYNYEVILTRTKDVYLPLEKRTAVANSQKCDLFISIHINAHTDKASGGIETYFLNLATDAGAMRVAALENATSTHSIGELEDILTNLMRNAKIDESTRLARFVHTTLVSGLKGKYPVRDLGVKQAPFYVLIGAEMPAILAELSFITNPGEAKLLQTEQYQDSMVNQIANGISNYVDHQRTAAASL